MIPMSILYTYTSLCTGIFMHIIAPTNADTGAWVSEMRAFRNCGNCRNCSILTPTSHLHLLTNHHLQPPQFTPTHPPQTLDITTFSPHFHYIFTHPCILSYTHAYNIIRKHNPPIGGHGFRISTFSTSITGTYRIPSGTDTHMPLNLRLLFLIFTNLP